jgi:tetratricopeptide (TPR) repeat protein
MSIKKISIIIILLVVGIALGSNMLFAERWHETYTRAVEYVENGNYGSAISLLNRLITDESRSKSRKRTYGTTFIEYIPYYYLGLCYYEKSSYSQAIAWLEKSKSEGVIQDNSDLYPNLRRMLSDAKSRQSASTTTPPVTTTQTPTATAQPVTTTQTKTVTPTATAPIRTSKPVIKKPAINRAQVAKFITNGKSLYNKGRYKSAGAEFRKALAKDPKSRDARQWSLKTSNRIKAERLVTEGKRYLDKRDYSRALEKYKAALEYFPRDSRYKKYRRSAEMKRDKQVAEANRKREIDSLYNKAFTAYRNANYLDAKINFNKVLQRDPTNRKAKDYLDDIEGKLAARAESDETKKQINDFLKTASASLEKNDFRTAKSAIGRAKALDENNADVQRYQSDLRSRNRIRIKTGLKFYLEGDLLKAGNILIECADVHDSNPALFAFLGSLHYTRYLLAGEKDSSLRTTADMYFRRVLELKEDYNLNAKLFNPRVIEYFDELKQL